jgi:hypothetical protein
MVSHIIHTMKTRVTITLDPVVHANAKLLARSRGTSVSGLVEEYLRTAAASVGPSIVDEMIGIAELRDPPRGTDPLYDAIYDKHVADRS